MVVNIAKVGNNTTAPSLTGWTMIDGRSLGGTTARYGAVLYRVADATEPNRYTFALGSGTTRAVGAIIAFSGALTEPTPFDVTPGIISVQPNQTEVVAASIETATANAALIMFGMAAASAPKWSDWNTGSPGVLTELYDFQSGRVTSVGAAWSTKTSAGETGVGTATLSAAQRNGAILIALKPFALVTETTTTVTTSGTPSVYGTPVTFTATVTPDTVVNGTAVDFFNGEILLGSGRITGTTTKTAAFTTSESQLSAGSHPAITATFIGDAVFAPSTSSTITQTVTTLEVTGHFTAQDKVYDGDNATVVLSRALSGVLEVDQANVELTGGTAAFVDAQAGHGKAVALTGAALDGPASGNYSLTSVTTALASITAKELTVTGATVPSKQYDGSTYAAITGATLDGVLGTDLVTLANAELGTFNNQNVGLAKPVASAMTVEGADAGNYTLIQPTLTGDITPASLTIRADNKAKFFGSANPALTAGYDGFVSDETPDVLTAPVSLITAVGVNSPPGVYSITASSAAAENYAITHVDGALMVVAAPQVAEMAHEGDLFMLTLPTRTGQQYQVEATDELVPPAWVPLGVPFMGTGGSVTVTNEIVAPQRYFRIAAMLADWPADNDARLQVAGGTNAITFVTIGRHPHMEIRTANGIPAHIRWHWGDGYFSTNSLLADHDFGAAGVHTNYVEIVPPEALTYFGAPYRVIGQGIKGVYGLSHFPNLNFLYLYSESITDLSLAGCSNLVQLHLARNPVSVETCDQWFIDLDQAVTGPVTGADFWYPKSLRSPVSDAAWTNLVSKGYIMRPF
jgi:hypothetical protein